MDPKKNFEELEKLALGEGMSLFGAADIREARKDFLLPQDIIGKFDYAISMGFALSASVLQTVEAAPNQIYYFHYQRANILLDQTALKVLSLIQKKGFDAFPIPASQVIDWKNNLGSVSHREIAKIAGLGWHGKNNLLVNERFASRVRYVTVLTDMPLQTGKPLESLCGNCNMCAVVCPANAISDKGYDKAACAAKLKEFSKIQGIGQMICGVCIKACPVRDNSNIKNQISKIKN